MILRLDVHLGQWLAILDVGGIAAGAAENNDLQQLLHVGFQLLINQALIAGREVTQMNGLGRIRVQAADQVAVDLIGHEGDHGSGELNEGHQAGIESQIGIDLVLL